MMAEVMGLVGKIDTPSPRLNIGLHMNFLPVDVIFYQYIINLFQENTARISVNCTQDKICKQEIKLHLPHDVFLFQVNATPIHLQVNPE